MTYTLKIELTDDTKPESSAPSGKNGILPPDPEGMNDSRADWARYALVAFMSQTGAAYQDAATDLICDLMHLADRDGPNFERSLEKARMHYSAETQDVEE